MASASQEHSRTLETVERDIARTRAELDDTLDVLTDRLSPHEMKERAVSYAKDTASSVGETVQRNPLTSAVATAGMLAALLWIRHRRARRWREQEELSRAVWQRIAAALDQPADGFSRARSALSGAVDAIGGLALDARERMAHAVGDATTRTRDLMDSDAARAIVDSVRRMVATIEDRSRERPLVALGIAALSGAVLTRMTRH